MRALSVVVALTVLGSMPAPADAADLPTGSARGVRVVASEDGFATFVFTRRAARIYRRIAGRRVSLGCTRFGAERLVFESDNELAVDFRAPKRRQRIVAWPIGAEGHDICSVALARHPDEHLVDIPLSQKGAVYLDERGLTGTLLSVLTIAGEIAADRGSLDWPSAKEVVDFFASRAASFWIVELEGPEATPPEGAVGYWSDGRAHMAVVMLSAKGRRLYVELDADDTLRTNVNTYLSGR